MKFDALPHEPNGTRHMRTNHNSNVKLGYSIREACQVSSLGRTTLYRHISEGRLRAIKLGGRTIIPATSLDALLAGDGQ